MPEDTGPCRMDGPRCRIRRPDLHPLTTSQTQPCANDANNERKRKIPRSLFKRTIILCFIAFLYGTSRRLLDTRTAHSLFYGSMLLA